MLCRRPSASVFEVCRGGSIVDATFIESPSSTDNAGGGRAPEAHQGKKRKSWHFGCKTHVGTNAGTLSAYST